MECGPDWGRLGVGVRGIRIRRRRGERRDKRTRREKRDKRVDRGTGRAMIQFTRETLLTHSLSMFGMFAVARVRDGEEAEIGNALDAGVDGVLVPHVSTEEQAVKVVEAGRFPPAGRRSLNPYVRGTRYGADGEQGRELADARSAILVMVEGAEGLENLLAIADTQDVDGVFVGPVDLSASLGVPGQPEHPKVIETVGGIFANLRDRKVASGVFAPTAEAAKRWIDAGASLVALSADTAMIQRAFATARAEVG